MPWDKDNLVINSCKKIVYFSFYFNLKIIRGFRRTLYNIHLLYFNISIYNLILSSFGSHNSNSCKAEILPIWKV
jgi:hypothetical protein